MRKGLIINDLINTKAYSSPDITLIELCPGTGLCIVSDKNFNGNNDNWDRENFEW